MISSPTKKRVVIVGAGMAGLSAARHLVARGGPAVDVRLLDGANRVGGLVRTEARDGFLLEWGPDSILVEGKAPWVDELELRGELLESTAPARTFVVRGGVPRPLPEHLMRLSAGAAFAMLASPLLSPRGKLALALEPFRPRRRAAEGSDENEAVAETQTEDESIGAFVRRRMGTEFAEAVAEPLLSGVYGAPISDLSLAACMPGMVRLEREHGSIGRFALARLLWPEDGPDKRLLSFRRGMGALVEALEARVAWTLTLGRTVRAVERGAEGLVLQLDGGETLSADAVILATPAHVTSRLVAPLGDGLEDALARIEHGSLLAVHLAWPRAPVPSLPAGTGFVVPLEEGRSMRACTFASEKWPGRAPRSHVLVRCFMTLEDDEDDTVVAAARRDLEDILGIAAPPSLVSVQRVPRALPRYRVGHNTEVARIGALVNEVGGLFLAGNAYGGVGLTACMASGERAAAQVLAHLFRHET